jgi:cytochrome c-type biogenesis protein
MLIFGLGAAAPLVLLGSLSRASMMRIRGRLLSVGKYGKQLFGLAPLVLGVLIATGVDKSLEAWVLNQTPEWLTAVTTKY